jgi:hypothetical protein
MKVSINTVGRKSEAPSADAAKDGGLRFAYPPYD